MTTVTALAPACRLLEVVDLTIDSRRLSEELSCLAQCCTQLRSVTFNGSNGDVEHPGAKMDAGLRELASRCPQLETLVFENIADSAYMSDSCDLTDGCLDLLAERCTRLRTLQFPGAARVSSGSLQRLGHACSLESVKLLNWMLLDDAAVAALAKPSPSTSGWPSNNGTTLTLELRQSRTWRSFRARSVALAACVDLRRVCCEVGDGVIVVVAGCPLLTSLELHGTAVGDRGVEAIGAGLDALEWLDLSECWRITDEALGYLHRCPRLKYLDVSMSLS